MTLVIPWLAAADQEMIFPNNQTFETPEAQEQFVRAWARKRTGMPCDFKARCLSCCCAPPAVTAVRTRSAVPANNAGVRAW